MATPLEQFFLRYASLSDEALAAVTSKFKRRLVKKNGYVLKPGNVCDNLVFVSSGCLRMYDCQNDVEVSVWFSFANSSAMEIYSFISGKPSGYFIQAIEDTEILLMPKKELDNLYKAFPSMQEVMRRFLEDVVINLIERFTALQKDSAERRYLDLLAKPAYMQTIPQKYLASFIGVTPSSLSRIRRKVK